MRLFENADWVPGPVVDGLEPPGESGDPGEAEPDVPESELKTTGEEVPKVEVMSDPVCEIGLAATEVVINKGEEPEEPEELEEPEEPEEPKDKVPNNPRENEIAVEPCDPVGLDVESVAVEAMDAVPVKAGLLLEGIPPLDVAPDL